MTWRIDDPQGHEADKVKYLVVPYTRGAVLDMGCGPSKAFPHFIGVDSCKDTELFNIPIKPDVNCDVSDPKAIEATFEAGSCDAIFSSHCLEHIEDYEGALRSWWSLLKDDGHLCLYLPHRDLYPNIGTIGANPDHKHDFAPMDIIFALERIGELDVLECETRDEGMEYSFLLVVQKKAQRHNGPYTYTQPKPSPSVCVVRYGGFGDMIQTSGILPALREAGFHVTVMTTPKGHEILKEDPHVDAWLLQDNDQVPNHELGEYWKQQATRFDKFVNLSESIEGTLLAIPGRSNHMWPTNLRRREMGKNYGEWTADLAGVPYESAARFYPTMDEAVQCKRYLAHVSERVGRTVPRNAAQQIMGLPSIASRSVPLIQPVFNVMWCLAGSSVHKAYPHMDSVIAKVLLEMPEAAIHLTGDMACQILEQGWEKEPRVFRQSGEMSIRQTLSLALACDCVVGPETGVLNAVAFEESVTKVLMLSHSSFENLPKHWANTVTVEPNTVVAPCFPCHRLHYGREFCPFEEHTHAAQCAFSITPATVFAAIEVAYRRWKNPADQGVTGNQLIVEA